ncbi:MAG: 1-acyl-sn-glycerol-3-phosphate acyltransferase [Acidimicrobiia bacterium]
MRWLAHFLLRLRGWTFEGEFPPEPKMVAIGAPHTSNWDFIVFLAALHHYKLRARFLAKDGLFRGPFDWLFRYLGGIPVNRSRPGGVVRQAVESFASEDKMLLVIAPEGTRAAAPSWKSGFLRIAETAGVPVLFAALDVARKRVVIGPLVRHWEDDADFMTHAQAFFSDKVGYRPENQGPVALA